MATDFPRNFGPLTSPVPLSYLDDNFAQLQAASTSTVSLAGAALIGYMPSGSGSVARTVAAELGDVVKPEHFGAKGDDSTDDTTALSNMFAKLGSSGGKVELTQGKTYRYTNLAITAITGKLHIQGNGATLKSTIGSSSAPFSISNLTSALVEGVTFELATVPDVDSDTSVANRPHVALSGSSGTHAERITVRDCRVNGAWSMGLQVFRCDQIAILNNEIKNALGSGIYSYNATRSVVISGNAVSNTRDDGIFYGCDSEVTGGTDNVVISGNTVYYSHEKGIGVSGVDGCAITGNTIELTYAPGILVFEDSSFSLEESPRVTVSGNTIKQAGKNFAASGKKHTSASSIANGIYIASASTDSVSVTGNVIYDSQANAISVNACKNLTVNGNVCRTNNSGVMISIGNSGASDNLSVENFTVTGNEIYNCVSVGIFATKSSFGVIAGNLLRKWDNGNTSTHRPILITTGDYIQVSDNVLYNDGAGVLNPFTSGTCVSVSFSNNRPLNSTVSQNFQGLTIGNSVIQNGTAAPASSTWAIGDLTVNTGPAAGEAWFWRCTVAGTPGTHIADRARGTFTMDADASTSVTDANCLSTSVIVLMPTNAAAATLVSGSKSPYVTPGAGSFTVNTADGGSAGGTETFTYMILN